MVTHYYDRFLANRENRLLELSKEADRRLNAELLARMREEWRLQAEANAENPPGDAA